LPEAGGLILSMSKKRGRTLLSPETSTQECGPPPAAEHHRTKQGKKPQQKQGVGEERDRPMGKKKAGFLLSAGRGRPSQNAPEIGAQDKKLPGSYKVESAAL